MPIERYDRYSPPRLHIVETGAYLLRDVLSEDGSFSGVCEYAVYGWGGEIRWHVCKEGVDFKDIAPFIGPNCIK